MAEFVISFDDMGGVQQFNGYSIKESEPYIINKAANYLCDTQLFNCDDEEFIDYSRANINWQTRKVILPIDIKF